MRIGDAAAAAGTTPRALRFYEQRGLLPPAPRTMTGQRDYSARDVARVRLVRELLRLGLTVEDVRSCADRLRQLEVEDGLPRYGGPQCAESGVVRHRLGELDAEIDRLTRRRDRLAAAVGLTDSGGRGAVRPVETDRRGAADLTDASGRGASVADAPSAG
ncbi:MerR family transcriptional regulator [Nonomuraea rhizosphaerae]|uniref:MerR family transcriptional regulator n=1 Tax=Nonomuraea rhizosphaerae TaxID=2665663 RepID=UPI001C5F92F5|nr:MerR family transcriptional regulator [Nonomuraea rhizosphaerae]